MKKIAVITSNRSDFGPVYWLIDAIYRDPEFELQLIVAGSHLYSKYGYTVDEIKESGIPISASIEYIYPHNENDQAQQISLGLVKASNVFKTLRPDMLICVGDRYELIAFATAAFLLNIPVAHFSGGEITQGAIDDVVRHVVTKMSFWHFVANERCAQRVISMGEQPDRVFVVGDVALDHLLKMSLIDFDELEKKINLKITKPYFLMTYHPETWTTQNSLIEQEKLLNCIKKYFDRYQVIVTYPNCDSNHMAMIDSLLAFQMNFPESVALVSSLGVKAYLTALKSATLVIGNSSSGLFEAPSYHTPTVNIGFRQAGRDRSASVFDANEVEEIFNAIDAAIKYKNDPDSIWVNPYGDGKTAHRVLEILKRTDLFPTTNQKHFYDNEVKL